MPVLFVLCLNLRNIKTSTFLTTKFLSNVNKCARNSPQSAECPFSAIKPPYLESHRHSPTIRGSSPRTLWRRARTQCPYSEDT